MNQRTPNWQPLSALPMFTSLINGMVNDTGKQWQTLQSARDNPHVLDSALVERIEKAYAKQLEGSTVLLEQLSRWRGESPSAEQEKEIARLEGQIEVLRANVTNVLGLAAAVKEHTIDKVMAKGDAELGLDVLLGRHQL